MRKTSDATITLARSPNLHRWKNIPPQKNRLKFKTNEAKICKHLRPASLDQNVTSSYTYTKEGCTMQHYGRWDREPKFSLYLLHYSTPKRVASFLGPSPRHCARATQLSAKNRAGLRQFTSASLSMHLNKNWIQAANFFLLRHHLMSAFSVSSLGMRLQCVCFRAFMNNLHNAQKFWCPFWSRKGRKLSM